jgi:plastocyanin
LPSEPAVERGHGADVVFTPDETGTFDLYCQLHPTAMTGTITVDT